MELNNTKNVSVFESIHSSLILRQVILSFTLGAELDLILTQTLNPVTKIIFGYSQMFGTESLQILKGGSKGAFNNWAYVMISVTPKFL